jgi:hypothetical protein
MTQNNTSLFSKEDLESFGVFPSDVESSVEKDSSTISEKLSPFEMVGKTQEQKSQTDIEASKIISEKAQQAIGSGPIGVPIRGVIEEYASIPDTFIINPVNVTANKLLEIFGLHQKFLKLQNRDEGDAVFRQNALQQTAKQLLDSIGVATPETRGEEYIDALSRTIGGTGAFRNVLQFLKQGASKQGKKIIDNFMEETLPTLVAAGTIELGPLALEDVGAPEAIRLPASVIAAFLSAGGTKAVVDSLGTKPMDTSKLLPEEISEGIKLNPEKLANLIELSLKAKKGDATARLDLAELSKANPEIKKIVDEYNLDVPLDILSDDNRVKELIAMLRSQVKSEASIDFTNFLEKNTKEINELLSRALDDDISVVAEKIKTRMNDLRENIKQQETKLYEEIIDPKIDRTAPVQLNNLKEYLNNKMKEYGENIDDLPQTLKNLQKRINSNTPVTYAYFKDLLDSLGQSMSKGKDNQFKSLTDANQSELYKVFKQDQEDFLKDFDPSGDLFNSYKNASELTVFRKDLENQIIKFFGKEGQGSISKLLQASISSGAKGDVSALNKVINGVPEDLREDAIIAGLIDRVIPRQGDIFGYKTYSNTWNNLKKQKEVFKIIENNVGKETVTLLDNIAQISQRIAQAQSKITRTGAIAVAEGMLKNVLTAESSLNAIFRQLKKGTGTILNVGSYFTNFLPVGGSFITNLGRTITTQAQSPKKVQDYNQQINELFKDPSFLKYIDEIAQNGRPTETTILNLSKNKLFKQYKNPARYLEAVVFSATDFSNAYRQEVEEEKQETQKDQDEQDRMFLGGIIPEANANEIASLPTFPDTMSEIPARPPQTPQTPQTQITGTVNPQTEARMAQLFGGGIGSIGRA